MVVDDMDEFAMTYRTVFFVSDQTGVTVETLGHSLLTQFDRIDFKGVTVPFVDNIDKATRVAKEIDLEARRVGVRPIVFISFVDEQLKEPVLNSKGLVLDFFEAFLGQLEAELQNPSSHILGKAHGIDNIKNYDSRMAATNFAMNADDGHGLTHYDQADLILVGVSRTGKTPTCLYLALHYGIFAANYPLTEDDLESGQLPEALRSCREKFYGLTIAPERLTQIRSERSTVGGYSSKRQVLYELGLAEALYRKLDIPFIDASQCSIEEIASRILNETGVERRLGR